MSRTGSLHATAHNVTDGDSSAENPEEEPCSTPSITHDVSERPNTLDPTAESRKASLLKQLDGLLSSSRTPPAERAVGSSRKRRADDMDDEKIPNMVSETKRQRTYWRLEG